jgi:hypothetical protein
VQPPVGSWLDIFLRKPCINNSVQEQGVISSKMD